MLIEKGQELVRTKYAVKVSLEWVRLRTRKPRALVFAPPLVGGTVTQQLRDFRWLVRRGFDFFTFNYSGHGGSSGRFSLGASLSDVHTMLATARTLGENEGLPLLGIASCYGAIPLLHSSSVLSEPLQRLVLINAISRLSPSSVLRSFYLYYRQVLASVEGVMGIRDALERYADSLLPGVVKSQDRFGALRRKRARLGTILSEFFILDPLRNVRLERTPVLCFYATHDPVLKIYASESWADYRRDIRRICPETEFCILQGDHFLSRPALRSKAAETISSFFETGLSFKF